MLIYYSENLNDPGLVWRLCEWIRIHHCPSLSFNVIKKFKWLSIYELGIVTDPRRLWSDQKEAEIVSFMLMKDSEILGDPGVALVF